MNPIIAAAAMVTAMGTIGGGAMVGLEMRQEIAANTTDRMIRQYEKNELRRQRRPLTRLEWQKHCTAGRYLEIFRNCPPRDLSPRRFRSPAPTLRRR